MTTKANLDNKPLKQPRFSAMADKFEYVKNTSAERMYERLKAFRAAIGTRPYKGLPVDEKELTARYVQIRNDPVAWKKIIEENAKVKEDGSILLPKKFVSSLQSMEKKLRDKGL